jgi:hypothetical protein
MQSMRTTINLEPDSEALVRRLMRERGLSFKQDVHEAIRAGAPEVGRRRAYRTPTFRMGRSVVPVDHALRLAGYLKDEETVRYGPSRARGTTAIPSGRR